MGSRGVIGGLTNLARFHEVAFYRQGLQILFGAVTRTCRWSGVVSGCRDCRRNVGSTVRMAGRTVSGV